VAAEAEVLVVKVLVDDTNHAVLAVVAVLLRAVVPDGSLVLNNDLEDIGSLALLSGEVEAGEETVTLGERLAGLAEAGLGDGVVVGEEVPLDNVTDLGDDVVGVEAETAKAGIDGVGDTGEGDDLVGMVALGLARGGSSRDSSSEEESGGEGLEREHFDGCS